MAAVDFTRVEASFSAALHSYEEAAHVQQQMAATLSALAADTLSAAGAGAGTSAGAARGSAVGEGAGAAGAAGDDRSALSSPLRVLEIGCGPGNFTLALLEKLQQKLGARPLSLCCNDLSQSMLEHTLFKVGQWEEAQGGHVSCTGVQGNVLEDAVQAQLQTVGPFAQVLSNAVFQWFPQLEKALSMCCNLLMPHGYLIFSSFASGTLHELKALCGAQQGLHYLQQDEVEAAIKGAGLKLCLYQQWKVQQFFVSAREALRHLQHTGVNACNEAPLSIVQMRTLLRGLEERFSCSKGVSLTWCPYVVVAQKQ